MFPTFDIPPQHAETVGARKARIAKEEETTRRSSSATSHSSESTKSATVKKSGTGWFGKSSKKGVQEISSLPSSLSKLQLQKQPEPEIREIEPCPPTARLPLPPGQRDTSRRSSSRANYEYHALPPMPYPSPPMRSLPSLPPSDALPRLPTSSGMFPISFFCSFPATWLNCRGIGGDRRIS